jgi:adenine-specific DNA-methyltransferase
MPELQFKGKEFVYNHHLSVPFRPLIPDADKSIGEPSLSGNLIIHGDNLHALKALLPMYAGKVDCIFIDPPYNTGNEGWSYNDNVSSPMMKEWLSSNPINGEDMLRHDKWCAMMWPRLVLLHELLTEDGVFFVSIDDNELYHLRLCLDEIFGESHWVGTVVWRNVTDNNPTNISFEHEYIVCFAKARICCPRNGVRLFPM